MPQCQGNKRDGSRCTQSVPAGVQWCFNHDPNRAEERRRNTSRAGRTKRAGEISDLKKQLKDLAADVLSGKVGRSEAAVINQILNTRARLIELERKIREQEELTERLEVLEEALESRKEGRLYGA
jgi:hypothetical protein